MALPLTYDDPLNAVFLRILAWERLIARKQPKVEDLVKNQVQAARKELGLSTISGGAPHVLIQNLRKARPPLLSERNTEPRPEEKGWTDEDKNWRLLYLPPHNIVRQLSWDPIYSLESPKSGKKRTYKEFVITLRNPSVPRLRVYLGKQRPEGKSLAKRRGVYFLRLSEGLYVGNTTEFHTRSVDHFKKRKPLWWIFVSPEGVEQTFALDTLEAAEALLISFWNEVSVVTNDNRGTDQEPAFAYLQQAVLLVEAASAILIWFVRESDRLQKVLDLSLSKWDIPFKKRCRARGWPDCYLKVPENRF